MQHRRPRAAEQGHAPAQINLGQLYELVVPSDPNGFGGSREAIEQFRRAGRLHARAYAVPLVFAGTHGSFVLDATGAAIAPAHRDAFFTVWQVALGGAR